jgi:poly(hydroxyalkanoate) depolymerase family esterase
MLKGLNRLWWSGVKQIRKAQKSQNKKLVKSLLAKPAAKRTRRIKAAPVKRIATASAARLAGKWLASYFSSYEVDGVLPARRMRYWLYLPANASLSPLPLVVMLHGCEQTADEFAQGTRMNLLAEQKGFAVLYPQQSLNAHPNRCWSWYKRAIQNGGGEAQMIAAIIGKVVLKNELDPSRIYLAGLSAGAAMAGIVALNYPHLIAAVGLHSGPVFGAAHSRMGAFGVMQHGAAQSIDGAIQDTVKKDNAYPAMPAILIHGRQDTVVRPINLTQSARQFKLLDRLSTDGEEPIALQQKKPASVSARSKTYQTDDYYAGKKLMLKVCEIFQLDHAWSGGDCTLRFNACKGPDASKMMWNFFVRHRRLA